MYCFGVSTVHVHSSTDILDDTQPYYYAKPQNHLHTTTNTTTTEPSNSTYIRLFKATFL